MQKSYTTNGIRRLIVESFGFMRSVSALDDVSVHVQTIDIKGGGKIKIRRIRFSESTIRTAGLLMTKDDKQTVSEYADAASPKPWGYGPDNSPSSKLQKEAEDLWARLVSKMTELSAVDEVAA